MALAGVLVLWGGNVEAAKTFPTDCAAVGGTMKDGVCYIGDGTQTSPIVLEINDDWQIYGGDVVIHGGSSRNIYGIDAVSSGAQHTGSIINNDNSKLIITGGDFYYSYGINVISNGNGSNGSILNRDGGKTIITASQCEDCEGSSGIQYNAKYGGNGIISNEGPGELIITGGLTSAARGIEVNVSEGGKGTISNNGSGLLTITGGAGTHTQGIGTNAEIEGIGVISNIGTGTLTISGGTGKYATGLRINSDDGGTAIISNTGDGNLSIMGGNEEDAHGIEFGTLGSGSQFISNEGAGTLYIVGGESYGAYGIKENANGGNSTIENSGSGTIVISGKIGSGIFYNTWYSGTSLITNTGSGNLIISGSKSWEENGAGIYYNTYAGGVGEISNTGTGSLLIIGGVYSSASFGIGALSREGGKGILINSGGGVVTISAGSTGSGIKTLSEFGGTAIITNNAGGVLNIIGNSESYGISQLTYGRDNQITLTNNGEMNLNRNAIREFFGSEAWGIETEKISILNSSTGTVNTEAEAIFEKTESTSLSDAPIGLLNPADGLNGNTEVKGFGQNKTVIAWDLKEDWAKYSHWEDGGVLNVTDVVEGSLAAQQIETAFTTLFGTGTELNFLGEDDWASGGITADDFTSAIGNTLIDQGYVGQIITNFNLYNAASDGSAQALTVGTGEGQVIKDSLGFRQIEGVSSLTVNSGKYFALIGLPAGGELIKGGAPVTLDNGTLMLGVTPAESSRTDSSTAGTLETVTMRNGSKIETENMWVQVATVEGQGDVTLTETGRMYVKDMNVEGNVKNSGTLSADTLTVSGTLETSKTLKSSGTIAVDSGSKLVADGYVVADKLDVKGVMIRGGKANVYTGAAAMDLLREANAEAAAEVDRVEGKAEVSTLSVLERIVAASMKTTTEDTTDDQTDAKQEAGQEEASKPPVVVTSKRRAAPILPQDAQAFAAFDAVNRIASDIDAGGTPDANGLWVKLLTGESEFGVRSGAKFEVDSDGAVIGAVAKLKPELKVGAALSYLDGEIDSGRAKNDWKSYGLTAYAHYKAGDFGLKGSAGWLRGTTEADEDYDADVWHAGVRAEHDLVKAPLTVTPFMGARLMSGSFDGMASQTVVNVPLGLKLAGELSTAGWTVTPALEASYVRSMGDTEAEDVRFLPKNAFTGALSLKAEKSAWTGELSLRGAAGSNDYEDRGLMAKVGYTF